MSKITRKLMKIFGSSAGTNQIAQFGSLYAGSSMFTTDPETIQALGNYLTGWDGAAIGGNSPAKEDMNALCYLYAYQLAYLMQSGVPEWNSLTTYYIGSFVTDAVGNLYYSRTDTNLNNAVSDTTNWRKVVTPMTAAGDLVYGGDATGTATRLAGNITTTKKLLTQLGNGSVSGAPAWGQIDSGGYFTSGSAGVPTAVGTVSSYFPVIQSSTLITTNADATSTTTDGYQSYLFSTGITSRNFNLPSAALNNGRVIYIKKIDAGTGALSINRAGSDTIEGRTSFVLNNRWDSVVLIADASNTTWDVFSTTGINASDGYSTISVYTGNGKGSVNTAVRRWTNIADNLGGSDITYADSSTLGGTFTINTAGVYTMSATDYSTSSSVDMGIVKNSTADPSGLSWTSIIAMSDSTTAGGPMSFGGTANLAAGDVIRLTVTAGATFSTANYIGFRIIKIS